MPKRKHDSEDEDIGQSEEEEVAPQPKKAKKARAKKRNDNSEDELPAKTGKKAKKACQQVPYLQLDLHAPKLLVH
jgi:hypothetical protein